MHVLHIFNEINFSGAEIMYADAAPLFQEKGVQMTAVSTGKNIGNYATAFEKANIKIIHRPISLGYKNPFFLIRYFHGMYSYIKKEKVDVVHIHRSDIFWYLALCTALAGRKSIMTPHSVFKNRKITWIKAYLERWSARKLLNTTFQTISETVYENELTYYKTPTIRVNNWYNPARFFPARENEKTTLRKSIGLSDADFVIISTGSCTINKNHTAIIEALSIVTQKHAPCIYLHLGIGELEEKETEKAAALNLRQQVRFLGNKNNVRDYLIASDVYIMASEREGLSIASLEAMACGLPCILYNSPGLKDLISNDDNGFLIRHGAEEIADKIGVFRNDPVLALEKGKRARHFVEVNFNMRNSVNRIIQLYNNGQPA